MTHIRYLAGQIGTRLAGSDAEAQASDYATQQLESWGYTVDLEPFPASGELLRRASVALPDGSRTFAAVPLFGSGAGNAMGPLVDAGTGTEAEFPQHIQGSVVLVQRRDVPFSYMMSRASEAGAIGVIVANKEAGLFLASSPTAAIPAVVVDQADGEVLRGILAKGPANVSLQVDPDHEVTAHNVIARPPDGHCRTITGGHYDSVPVSAGATDNASGAGTVLELARAAASAHLTGDCFVLFSAEEEGLIGSAYFVQHLTAQERSELQVMLNYDVTAGVPPPQLIGDDGLAQRAMGIASGEGQAFLITTLGMGYGSDHASFSNAGVPALMFSADDKGVMHTPRDTVANVRQDTLQVIADVGFAMLQDAPPSETPVATP